MLFPRARKAFTSDLTFRIIPRHRRQDLVRKLELFGIAFGYMAQDCTDCYGRIWTGAILVNLDHRPRHRWPQSQRSSLEILIFLSFRVNDDNSSSQSGCRETFSRDI
jgi:hypothetical protein